MPHDHVHEATKDELDPGTRDATIDYSNRRDSSNILYVRSFTFTADDLTVYAAAFAHTSHDGPRCYD